MANYLIVVPRGNSELFDLLAVAFRGHRGVEIVIDRREPTDEPADDCRTHSAARAGLTAGDRRDAAPTPGPDEIVVAERPDDSERAAFVGDASRLFRQMPALRRALAATATS